MHELSVFVGVVYKPVIHVRHIVDGVEPYTSIKNHFYKMKRDIGMADYEKQVKQEFHTPSLYLCFVIGA